MDLRCIFPQCSSSASLHSRKKSSDVSVFPFPKEPTLRCKWLGNVPGLKKRLTSSSGICSKHFLLRDFNEKEDLRPGAVPHNPEAQDSPSNEATPSLSSLSDLADQLETHPEAIPPHIQHLTSSREYSFYKIRFLPKRPPSVSFSLIIYDDLSFDVSHKGRANGKNFRLKALGERLTFRCIEEVRDVLEELDAIPETRPHSRIQKMEDCVHILSDLSERSSGPELHKMEFLMEQIRLLDSSTPKRYFSKKTAASLKALLGRIPPSQHKILGNFLTLPEFDNTCEDSVKEVKDFCRHLVENAEFFNNDEFKTTLTSRIAEKDSPVKDVVAKTLNRLWGGNLDEYPPDLCVTVLLLLNEICSLYAIDTSQEEQEEDESFDKSEEIVVKEELMLGEEGSSPLPVDEDMEDEEEEDEEGELMHLEDEEMEENLHPNPVFINGKSEEEGVEEESLGDESCDFVIKFSYNCCFCTHKLKSFDEFLKHCSDMHYGVDVVLKITPGPVLTIKKSLTEFTCADCKTEYASLLDMNNHVNFHAQSIRKSTRNCKKKVIAFNCGICEANCIDKNRLKLHYATSHPTYSIFECKRCSQLFYKCSEYLKHKLYFHKKRAVNPDKLYGCEMCERKFRFKHYLDKHYAADHQQRKYTCDSCGRLFDTQRYLTKHKARVHPDSFDYICELCGKKFAINEYLNSHKKICKYRRNNTVKEDNKLQCDKCYRFFSSEVYLSNHKAVVHDKTKAYVCSVCDKHLLSLVNLKLHMATHEENRPKYPCNQCGKEYLNKTTLQFHILTTHEKDKNEKNFKCKECDWSFWEKKNLKNHIKLVHEKVYDYKCDICGRAFGCRRHLLRHKTTIHDKFREYKCHICSVEYFQRPSLKNHLKKVHNITDYMPPKLVKEDET